MTAITSEQFTQSFYAAVAGVYHVYEEVDKLNKLIREGLGAAPAPMAACGGIPAQPGKSYFRTIRWHYGDLFRPTQEAIEDIDDEESALEDEEEGRAPRLSGTVELDPAEPLLAVRVLLHRRQREEAIEPRVIYAVTGRWRVGDKPLDDKTIRIPRHRASRVISCVRDDGNASSGRTVRSNATIVGERRNMLTFDILGPTQSVPLFHLEGDAAVSKMIAQMKEHWKMHSHS